MSNQSQNFNW